MDKSFSKILIDCITALIGLIILILILREVKWFPFYEHRPDKWHLFLPLITTSLILIFLAVLRLFIARRDKDALEKLFPFISTAVSLFLLFGNFSDKEIIIAAVILLPTIVGESYFAIKNFRTLT